MFLTLEYSISMHLHSTFHEICTIHECIHIVRTPKCREISQKVMAQPGFEPGTFLFRGCSNHWAIRPSLQLCDNFTCKFVKIWAQICDKIFRMNKIYSFKAYFELNFDPGPKFKLKMGFQNFFKVVAEMTWKFNWTMFRPWEVQVLPMSRTKGGQRRGHLAPRVTAVLLLLPAL